MFTTYEVHQVHQDDLRREADQWRLAHRAAAGRRARRRSADRRAATRTRAHARARSDARNDVEGPSSPAAPRRGHRPLGGHTAGLDRVRRALHPHSAA